MEKKIQVKNQQKNKEQLGWAKFEKSIQQFNLDIKAPIVKNLAEDQKVTNVQM